MRNINIVHTNCGLKTHNCDGLPSTECNRDNLLKQKIHKQETVGDKLRSTP